MKHYTDNATSRRNVLRIDSIPPSDEDLALFTFGPPRRKMRVMVDAECLPTSSGTTDGHLLAGLLADPYIQVLRYADEGAPADLLRHDDHVGEFANGWVVVTEIEDGLRGHLATYGDGDEWSQSSVAASQWIGLASQDSQSNSYSELDAKSAAARRSADTLAVHVACDLGMDVYITSRPYLFESRPIKVERNIIVLSPDEALPLVGLFLRRHGKYIIWRTVDGTGTSTFNRGLFYWVASRALLPQAWRWMTACVQQSHATDDDTWIFHGQSLVQRVDQALRARDEIFIALGRPQNNDTADDALAALDRLLLMLMGAVDVSARVAHMVLELDPKKLYEASWKTGGKWVKLLRKTDPDLADLSRAASYGDPLTILRLLRNTVHGAALEPLAVSEGSISRRTDTLVGLPSRDAEELLRYADRQGGRSAWGMRELIPGRIHADIDVLVERLLPDVLAFLNEAMRLTPVEKLEHADLAETDPVAARSGENAFSEINQQLVLAQLGLSRLSAINKPDPQAN